VKCAQQPLLGGVAHAEVGGQVQQAVRRQGVHDEGGVEVEVQALGAGQFGHLAGHLAGLRPEPPGQVLLGRHRGAGRGVGVQLETPPGDLDLAGVLELAERVLKPALADVAPGAHDVGPDLDLHSSAPVVAACPGASCCRRGTSQKPSAQTPASVSPRVRSSGATA
jgi:hypothetical protein